MKKLVIYTFFYFILIFAHIFPVFSSPNFNNETIKIISNNQSFNFNIEIADTKDKRRIGLMYRKTLALDGGMLFIYPKSQIVNMWMKNTLLPLDVLFFSTTGKIIKIVHNTIPLDETPISSELNVLGFLELPAGTSKSLNIKVGSFIEYKLFNKVIKNE